MLDEDSRIRTFVWLALIVIFLVGVMAVIIPPAQALTFGTPTPTPTPVPTPVPTPQIVYVTVIVTPEPTPTPVEAVCSGGSCSSGGVDIHTVIKVDDQAGVLFIARGDDALISGRWDSSANYNKLTSFWLFGTYSNLDFIYDQSVTVDAENNYHIYLTPEQTNGLKIGKYIGLVQFSGRDGRKISYDTRANQLISPFRDVEPISTLGFTPGMVYQEFMALLANKTYNDDIYEIYDIRVEDPWINVNQNYAGGDIYNPELYISGETNLGTSNTLTITLDPERQTNSKLLEAATRVLKVNTYPNPLHPRNTWDFIFPTTGLFPGWHTLLIKSMKFGVQVETRFELREEWNPITPTPTPRIVVGFPSTPATPTPIPQPTVEVPPAVVSTVVAVSSPLPQDQSYVVKGQESWTLSPTPIPSKVSTAVPTPTPTKKLFLNAKADSPIGKSLQGMPINPIVTIMSLIAGIFLFIRGGK